MKKDESVIPKNTSYCYELLSVDKQTGNMKIRKCPYWEQYWNPENWKQIYVCHYLDEFDERGDTSLIWDMCKNCDIGMDE